MATKVWRPQPLHITILEILEKKNSLTDVELLEMLRNTYGYKDISFNELNKTIMRMEITGLILVSSLTKGKRLIQLAKK
ncbi:MAG: hypothetical protein QXR84_00910 [Candidatus Bathyarchaeia archaeon]|nr:hypothetical protein [Candidatus Bathyarchaeota archaeon]